MISRREMLGRVGTGLGLVGLAGLMSEQGMLASEPATTGGPLAPRAPHFAPRAKRIIHLYMNGGPSQVDTFDPKPALATYQGQRPASIANLRTENNTAGLRPSPFRFPPQKSGVDEP